MEPILELVRAPYMAQELPFSIYVIAYAVAILVTAKAVRVSKSFGKSKPHRCSGLRGCLYLNSPEDI
jgi:hypothetical protein